MCMTDPIASMLTQIRNSVRAKHSRVDIPYSQLKEKIVRVLADERYIADYKVVINENQKYLRLYLSYTETGEGYITDLQRVSTPGLRVYVGVNNLPRVLGGLGIAVLSTPKGVMTNKKARLNRVGGEVLCTVW